MKLILVYSKVNMTARLINIDAQASEVSSNRILETWVTEVGVNLRHTVWNNDRRSTINPYKYNRVNLLYNLDKRLIRKSYYCINDLFVINDMTFNYFDEEQLLTLLK